MLTLKEASEYLWNKHKRRVLPGSLGQAIRRGSLKGIKRGIWHVEQKELDRYEREVWVGNPNFGKQIVKELPK